MTYAKRVNKKTALLPWENDHTYKPLNGNEINLIKEDVLIKYIDTPVREFENGKTYYKNGLHFKSEMNVHDFVEAWNNNKYSIETPQHIKNNWMSIKQAEMQQSNVSYEVGYFMGTNERGQYKTIQQYLQKNHGNDIEISYQFINQPGITPKIWEQARKLAAMDYPNPQSREHKRIKFANAPSALVVYTTTAKRAKQLRSLMIEKYSKMINNTWPTMPDGSKMRFIPILQGYIKDNTLFKRLQKSLFKQSRMKAGEVTLDLKLKDIFEEKEYLDGKSLEQVIHSVQSKGKKGMPLFKHISNKWTREPKTQQYEIIISPCMLDEATKYMKGIKNNLVKIHGNEVLKHFINTEAIYNQNNKGTSNKNFESEKTYKEFLEVFEEEDPYADILIEGMELVELQEKYKTDLDNNLEEVSDTQEKPINVGSRIEGKTNNNGLNEVSINDELMSNVKNEEYAKWEDITIVDELSNCSGATEKEMEKVTNTINKLKITTNEIETWKNKNWTRYDDIAKLMNGKEYSIIKIIVDEILITRKIQANSEKEEKTIGKLMAIVEGNANDNDQMDIDTRIEQNLQIGTPNITNENE